MLKQVIQLCFGFLVNYFECQNKMFQVLKELPREKIQLATKFGLVRAEPTHIVVNGTPEYVRSCCEATLKHLDVGYIDLYYQHRIDTSIPIEETVKCYNFRPSNLFFNFLQICFHNGVILLLIEVQIILLIPSLRKYFLKLR